MLYKLVTTPDTILAKQAQPVTRFDAKLHEIVENMAETLIATEDPKGVGLAAPQVGFSLKIFQMRPTERSRVTTYINPVIKHISEEESEITKQSAKVKKAQDEGEIEKPDGRKLLEGCLSIPNIWGYVTRKKTVTLAWQDEKGKPHTKEFKGFPAIIVQHEMDHLNGVLFTKHVMTQKEKLYKSHKEKGEDVFEEITLV